MGNVVRGALCSLFSCKSSCKICLSFSLCFFFFKVLVVTGLHLFSQRTVRGEREGRETERVLEKKNAMLAGIKPYLALCFLLLSKQRRKMLKIFTKKIEIEGDREKERPTRGREKWGREENDEP